MSGRRGLSKVVAATLMALLAVGIGVAIYSFSNTYVSNRISVGAGSHVVLATVENEYWKGDLVLYISNRGNSPINFTEAFMRVNNEWVKVSSSLPVLIPPNDVKDVVISTKGIPAGRYELTLSGPQGFFSTMVSIPSSTTEDYIGLVTPTFTIGSPLKPARGWLARYYDIRGLPTVPSIKQILSLGSNRLILTRVDPTIDFSTKPYEARPWNLPRLTRFAAVYEGTLMLQKLSKVTIIVRSDDGVYVVIDGKTVINGWRLQPETWYRADITLSAGTHYVEIVYFQNYGDAVLIVNIKATPIVSGTPFTITDIMGKYFNTTNYNPAHPDVNKVLKDEYPLIYEDHEKSIDYDDHYSPYAKPWPFEHGFKNVDHFAAHWRIFIHVNTPGTYLIRASSDDGMKILVDGVAVISDWTLHPVRHYKKEIYLSRGSHVIDIAYYENEGYAIASFSLSFLSPSSGIVSGWSATVYDIISYHDWWNLNKLYNMILNGKFPVVGTYKVNYIDYTDTPYYGGRPWFFRIHDMNYFSVVFKSEINVRHPGTMVIKVYTDDGTKVLLDDRVVLNAWRLQPPTHYSASIPVSPGKHTITIVYFERTGIARLRVTIKLLLSEVVYAGGRNEFTLIINDFHAVPKSFWLTIINSAGDVIFNGHFTLPSKPPAVICVKLKNADLPTKGAVAIWG